MKKVRQFSKNPLFIGIIGIGLIFSSFSRNKIIENRFESTLCNYESKDLFKGLLFNSHKELTNQIPELNKRGELKENLDASTVLKLNEFENLVIEMIDKNDDTFFDDFKKVITSKDHSLIKAKLVESYDIVNENMLLLVNDKFNIHETNIDLDIISSDLVNKKGELDLKKLNDLQAILQTKHPEEILLLIVIVAVAVVVFTWAYVWKLSNNEGLTLNSYDTESLEFESMINNIVKL